MTISSVHQLLGMGDPTQETFKGRGKSELGQEDFLALMVAQLENQDPTKPMDNNEFLSQMAQFSMVNGIEDLNGSFSSVSESVLGSQGLQAATLLDRQAIVETDSAGFDGVAPVQGLIDQPEPMSQLELQIRDAQGALVRSCRSTPVVRKKCRSSGMVVIRMASRLQLGIISLQRQVLLMVRFGVYPLLWRIESKV